VTWPRIGGSECVIDCVMSDVRVQRQLVLQIPFPGPVMSFSLPLINHLKFLDARHPTRRPLIIPLSSARSALTPVLTDDYTRGRSGSTRGIRAGATDHFVINRARMNAAAQDAARHAVCLSM